MGCRSTKERPEPMAGAAVVTESSAPATADDAAQAQAAAMIQRRVRGRAARKDVMAGRGPIHKTGRFTLRDGKPAGKSSRLYLPTSMPDGPIAAAVLVHGVCVESKFVAEQMGRALGIGTFHWTYPSHLAEQLAERCGIAVLMIGLHDDDEDCTTTKEHGLQTELAGQIMNGWPSCHYSIFLEAAIDHLCLVVPRYAAGVEVDAARIALVGHSMGGAGVLYAAAHHCKARIAAVAALNPGHASVHGFSDMKAHNLQFAKGAAGSGEFGKVPDGGEFSYLAEIACPTLVYGSRAEVNVVLLPGSGCPMWPHYPRVFEKIGAPRKELYVDGITDKSCIKAHTWMGSRAGVLGWAEGATFNVLSSFLRRHLATAGGESESVPEKPACVAEWAVHA